MRFVVVLRISAVVVMLAASAGLASAQSGRAFGVVRDDRNQPVKGATVTATADNPETNPGSFTSTTDDKGRFAMIGMKSGVWNVVARAPGYSAAAVAITVRQTQAVSPPLTFE